MRHRGECCGHPPSRLTPVEVGHVDILVADVKVEDGRQPGGVQVEVRVERHGRVWLPLLEVVLAGLGAVVGGGEGAGEAGHVAERQEERELRVAYEVADDHLVAVLLPVAALGQGNEAWGLVCHSAKEGQHKKGDGL